MKWVESWNASEDEKQNFWIGSQWFMLYRRNRDFIMHFQQDHNFTNFFGALDKSVEHLFKITVMDYQKEINDGHAIILKWIDHNQMWFMNYRQHPNKFICPLPDCGNVDLFFTGEKDIQLDKNIIHEKIIIIKAG